MDYTHFDKNSQNFFSWNFSKFFVKNSERSRIFFHTRWYDVTMKIYIIVYFWVILSFWGLQFVHNYIGIY